MMRWRSWTSLYLLYLIGVVLADQHQCYLRSVCEVHLTETASTVALMTETNTLSAMYTCMPPGSVTGRTLSVDWFYKRLVSDRDPVVNVPITNGPRFTISGSSLAIRNLTGEHEAQYLCNITVEGMSPITDHILGCLVVQGRAYFINCTGTLETGGSCTGEAEEVSVGKGQQAMLDMRVGFRYGGICEIQNIRFLRVEHNGVSVYNCSNMLVNQTEPCYSTEKYLVDNSQCSLDGCTIDDRFQCCKFMIVFVVMNVSDGDLGSYRASVLVDEGQGVRTDITKSFSVVLAPSTSDPGPTPTTGSTLLIGSGSTGVGTRDTSVGAGNVAGIIAGVVVGLFILAALSLTATVGFLYCWHQKKGLWTINKDYVNAAGYEIEGGRDQFDMDSTVSGVSKLSLQSRKEKASSVVGPELGFDLPAGRDSEELRI